MLGCRGPQRPERTSATIPGVSGCNCMRHWQQHDSAMAQAPVQYAAAVVITVITVITAFTPTAILFSLATEGAHRLSVRSAPATSTATASRSCWEQGRKFAAVFWRLPRFDRTFTGLERRLELHLQDQRRPRWRLLMQTDTSVQLFAPDSALHHRSWA
jgi:hypothetical protein